MAVPIIVVTPNPGFGELICQILEEAGGYSLALTINSEDALMVSKKENPAVCIVDGDLKENIPDFVVELKKIVPDMLVVFIPQDATTEDDEAKVNADGYLAKPFYLPDLVTTVHEVVQKSKSKNANRTPTGPLTRIVPNADNNPQSTSGIQDANYEPQVDRPDWLKDVDIAAQHLARLSLESSSQASLITRGEKVWAYAGELPQPAVQELAETVAKYYSVDSKSDLARFIHLEATGGEYMLYATGIEGDYILALVFNAEMPFSKIRSHASKLAKALTERPQNKNISPNNDVESIDIAPADENNIENMLEDVPPPIPTDWIPDGEPSEGRKSFLEDLIENDILVDSPLAKSFTTEPISESQTELNQENVEVSLAYDEDEYGVEVVEDGEVPLSGIEKSDILQSEDTMVSASRTGLRSDLQETLPSGVPYDADTGIYKLEPVSPSVYNLTYACVLIPRLPGHHLTGILATNLSEWITQLSLAFGWRLEHLSIRPEYLQWLINVPPATSPGYLMRIIRQHSSRRMFVEFPRMIDENPSGDFWAPGYLIMSGNQPPPPQLVKDFIKDTRRRQGISR